MSVGVGSVSPVDLLRGLVEIPSISGEEAAVAAWLVERMAALGYERAAIDDAGNAVGELGPPDAERVVVLLGHLDTVPGEIPVRIEESAGGPVLYGRGSVDAKGPLAALVAGAARLGGGWARGHGVRLVVAGAVEEETATSRGARHLRDRFDGEREPRPAACVIGEPSGWSRITLGYKGRLLVSLEAARPMAHTAGPDPGVATAAVAFWQRVEALADAFNAGRDALFDRLQPSLRRLATSCDPKAIEERVIAEVGLRLPPGFAVEGLREDLLRWAGELAGAEPPAAVELRCRGYEPAWRSAGRDGLARAFRGAVRTAGGRPSAVVKTGTSDMNVVAPAWRCPILAYGPGDSRLDHTPGERLALAEYGRAIDVVEGALRRLVPATRGLAHVGPQRDAEEGEEAAEHSGRLSRGRRGDGEQARDDGDPRSASGPHGRGSPPAAHDEAHSIASASNSSGVTNCSGSSLPQASHTASVVPSSSHSKV